MKRGTIFLSAILLTFALLCRGSDDESCGPWSTPATGVYYVEWDPNLGFLIGPCPSGLGTPEGITTTVSDTTKGNGAYDALFTFSLSALPSGCALQGAPAVVIFHAVSAGESFNFSYLHPSKTLTLGTGGPVCPASPADVITIPDGSYDATPELFEVDVTQAIQEAITVRAEMFQFQMGTNVRPGHEHFFVKRSLLPDQVSMAPVLQIGTPSDAPPAGSSRKCARGETGPTGPDHCAGPTGKIGITGKTGQTGRTGLTAEDGKTGKTGVTHITGKTGPTEEEGKVGKTGVTHITGKTGPTREEGKIGKTGVTHMTGKTGRTGVTGRTSKTAQTGITILK